MGRTKQQIWQSNANKAITQSKLLLKTKKLGKIIKLIEDMQKLIIEARKYDDIATTKVSDVLKSSQEKLFTLGTNLGAKLASMRANSNYYVDHPVHGRLTY